jgi:hypothetical protein
MNWHDNYEAEASPNPTWIDVTSRPTTATGSRCPATARRPRPGEPVLDIFADVRLSKASKEYAWVNERQIWGVGTASLATRTVLAEGFMQ